jgi:hypothetical protein
MEDNIKSPDVTKKQQKKMEWRRLSAYEFFDSLLFLSSQ